MVGSSLIGWPSRAPGNAVAGQEFHRVALAAAHIVADPLSDADPWLTAAIDWDATIAYRRHLWSLGLGRRRGHGHRAARHGAGLAQALKLIRLSVEAARDIPGAAVFSGVGTDQLAPTSSITIDDVIRAYEEQIEAVEACGGRIVLMASRALVVAAKSPDDYAKVYGRILEQVREPLIIHWLGEMFDPALQGYWGNADHIAAMDVCVDIIADHASKVDGVKLSLLDKDKEIRMRRRLPQGVRCYTGDDFNFAELIAGDEQGYSHALLGIFDAIAPAASAALAAHARGDMDEYWRIFEPTVPLVAPSVQGADALLQDRNRVSRLPQRPPVAFRDGRRPGERPCAAASGRGFQAGGCRRPHSRSGSGGVSPRRRAARPRRGGLKEHGAARRHSR